ncbi:Gti1/Pac2 family-domain-containing protein [Daldinia caldariorum]|uniref:Gti1/Pac2 family-domain-containing protein n=1 Tax=Daldinia caldariorum TaxID=326644 RepID=UPI002008C03B|nr:Gti1/Pac2 family-domain-containing protein [Daldinia caldariorum]KAI1468190.1 Gti1/Pac2 family-domain-containing protein [Daldinia caldariorum]
MSGVDRPGGAGNPLNPTFFGYIASTMDALILFEGCLNGHLSHVPRRPHDRERSSLIVSGNVFIYEENSSGIKRWTDGVPWSPSRILGNFLLYRELDKPFQPGEKKRAMKRQRNDAGVTKTTNHARANSVGSFASAIMDSGHSLPNLESTANTRNEAERALVGSLVDSYQFKQDGLIKKTISVTYQGIQHHLVSYYSIEDVIQHKLCTPSQDERLRGITPRAPLISSGSFRAPVDDHEILLAEPHFRGVMNSSYNAYAMNGAVSRSYSMPSMNTCDQMSWAGSTQYAAPYGMGQTLPPPVPYPTASSMSYDQSPAMSYGMIPRTSLTYSQPARVPPRRHSTMNGTSGVGNIGTNGVGNIDYSGLPQLDRALMSTTQLLGGGASLGGQNLSSQSPYTNTASIFDTPANTTATSAVVSTPSNHHRDVYNHNGANHSSANQNNDLYSTSIAMHSSSGIEGHMENGFNARTTRHTPHEFNVSLPEHHGHNVVNAGQDDTSSTMQLGLDNVDSAANPMPDVDWTDGFMQNGSYPQDSHGSEQTSCLQSTPRQMSRQQTGDQKIENQIR